MEVKAQLRQLRIAPRKVRLVANLVRGLMVTDAENQLQYLDKRSALPVLKLIRSATANAEHNYKLKRDDLFIKTITVDDGATLRRWQPRAMGRATILRKRSSHICVVLDVQKSAKQKAKPSANTQSTKSQAEAGQKTVAKKR